MSSPDTDTIPLFDLPDVPREEKELLKLKGLEANLWTENKAALIHRYLRYFVFITHHGTYIDAFAGPQQPDHPQTWAAKAVLESEPKWFRTFLLFEKDPESYRALKQLREANKCRGRRICLYHGDSNVLLPERLASHPFKPSEACFCLLDQRTFECDWATVASVARHKADGMKIEIFYFLAQGWLNRAVSGLGDPEARMTKWWGRDDWGALIHSNQWRRTDILCDRFTTELGYAFCCAFPIYSRDDGGRLMFSMIHASDHPEAPKLMVRAYNNAIAPLEPMEQLELEFQKPAD